MTLFSPKQIGLLKLVETLASPTFKLKINKSQFMSYFLVIIKSLVRKLQLDNLLKAIKAAYTTLQVYIVILMGI